MPEAHTLVMFGLASLVLLVVPGPAVFYIITRSITEGRRAGVVSMLGIEAGGLVHVAAASLGVSVVLAASAAAFAAVKYLGAAYLIYLGVRKLAGPAPSIDFSPAATAASRLFWQGVAVQVLNPKTAMFFLAFLPQFVDPTRGAAALQVVVLGCGFTVLALLSDGLYVLAAGTTGNWLAARTALHRRLERLSGGVYIGLGAALALSGDGPASSDAWPPGPIAHGFRERCGGPAPASRCAAGWPATRPPTTLPHHARAGVLVAARAAVRRPWEPTPLSPDRRQRACGRARRTHRILAWTAQRGERCPQSGFD